ncbi:nuclease-related domain-containing protein [Geomicrobium sp. JSM 1781026]|uniref:nuclease-related domain-containing protein n=1 Tax=Geomicrobium sp. JSM 1781026 TaxID=3344580 RepID=UPI0035C0CC9E
MITYVKPIKPPEQLLMLRSLVRRLPTKNPVIQNVRQKLSHVEAGYTGEKLLGKTFHHLFSDSNRYLIFHNIRLKSGSYFQIDFIVLTAFYALILENKHINGSVHFGTLHQFSRKIGPKIDIFENPLDQCLRQEKLFSNFLETQNFPFTYPVICRVILSSHNTKITASAECREAVFQRVLRLEGLLSEIHALNGRFTEPILTSNQITRLSKTILHQHTPSWKSPLSTFDIKQKTLPGA